MNKDDIKNYMMIKTVGDAIKSTRCTTEEECRAVDDRIQFMQEVFKIFVNLRDSDMSAEQKAERFDKSVIELSKAFDYNPQQTENLSDKLSKFATLEDKYTTINMM